MAKKYIGITIGPIFDMMSLVTSPAALWATSYMFSTISKKACEKLHSGYKEKAAIISPYFNDPEDELFNKRDGIGLFHDRIIIECNGITLADINSIKNDVLIEVSKAFGLEENELSKRVLFAAAEFETEENESPILKGGKILDSLELPKKIVFNEKSNPIADTFTGALKSDDREKQRTSKNSRIKDIAKTNLGIDPQNWSLLKDNSKDIKSLEDIAASVEDSGMKKHNYYAIVRSDGDNMSKIIEKLKPAATDGNDVMTISAFSKTCLEYCAEVAKIVKQYNGVPIYSSGDDLLAIMPCSSANNDTVFDFVKDVNKTFSSENMFGPYITAIKEANKDPKQNKAIPLPSLSFGISICYSKFPLYEALEDSANLLFGIAKKDDRKNCTVVRLQKHSGQSEGLLIYNDALDDFLKIHDEVKAVKGAETKNELLLSALYKTEKFEYLFNEAVEDKEIQNLFINTFDAPEHNGNAFVHTVLPDFYKSIHFKNRISAITDDGLNDKLNNTKVFNYALRILKFFVEKSGKEGA